MTAQHEPDLFEAAALSELHQQQQTLLEQIRQSKPYSRKRIVTEDQLRRLNLRMLRMENNFGR